MPTNTTIPTLSTGNVLSAADYNYMVPLNTTFGMFNVGSVLAGTAAAVTAPNWYMQGGQATFTFSSGLSGTFNFPSTFPNGLLTVVAMPFFSGTAEDLVLTLTGFTTAAFSLGCRQSGSSFTGSFGCTWFAIGC